MILNRFQNEKEASLSAVASGVSAALMTKLQGGDEQEILENTLRYSAVGLKWGAIGGLTDQMPIPVKAVAVERVSRWRQAEHEARQLYGGEERIAFLAGEIVDYGQEGAYRPSFTRIDRENEGLDAYEVISYNLLDADHVEMLLREVERKIFEGEKNLPAGSVQHFLLKAARTVSSELISSVVEEIYARHTGEKTDLEVEVLEGSSL